MIKNYLQIALRTFLRNRNYTVINILGLSIGITTCIVIFLLITYELSFDRFHSRYENIYRIVRDVKTSSGDTHSSTTAYPFATAFRNDFSDVPLVTQVHFQSEAVVAIGDEKQKVKDILFADSLFFSVFDFTVLSGKPQVDLGEPGKVFLTKSVADRLLKDSEKTTIRLDKIELEVVGIIADPPPNSHISFSMIVSMESFTGDFIGGFDIDSWGLTARGFTYIVLPENKKESIETSLVPFVKKYHDGEDVDVITYKLQALRDIHFDTAYDINPSTIVNANITDLTITVVLGVFILGIACINFINLATASAEKKSKEIGIRKTLGAQQRQLTGYFLTETFLLTLFAVLLSLGATEWLLTWLNPFLEKEIDLHLFSNGWLILFLILLITFTTILAGFYPAIVLSRFNPTAVLRGRFLIRASSGASLRKVLVVFQFVIAQLLIIGTLVISSQMEYFKSKSLGFDKEAIINIPVPNNKPELQAAFRTRLESNPDIQSISFASGAPISDNDIHTDFYFTERGRTDGVFNIDFFPVDTSYLKVYGLNLLAGRWFNDSDMKRADIKLEFEDQKYVYILNESAIHRLGFQSPEEIIGKFVTTGFGGVSAEVVGVVRDFHVSSLHQEIGPVVFSVVPFFYYDAGIKVNTNSLSETVKFIEQAFTLIYPENFYEYTFLDEHVTGLYRSEEKTFMLFRIFAGVSIFIGCLGLYGLVSYVATQKQKEVGIRKVMGASIAGIVLLFSREFIKLISIAFVIAIPLAWFSMNAWLENFVYKTNISWTVFLVGFMVTLGIVLATIMYRAIRAASVNPATTLRNQ